MTPVKVALRKSREGDACIQYHCQCLQSSSHSFCYWPSFFFSSCSQTSVPPPLPTWALSPASMDSWMPREAAAGGSEPRPLLRGHQNCSFTRCLNRTDTVSEHSECNSSPKAPTEGIGRRKTHDMLCWANRCKGFIYVQGQGHKDFYPHPDNVKAQGPVSIDFVPSVQTAT